MRTQRKLTTRHRLAAPPSRQKTGSAGVARLLLAGLGIIAATLLPLPAQAAVTETWVHRYSNVVSNANDRASKIVLDAAGDIIVTGTTDDGITGNTLTIKYSGANGSVIWQKRYNGSANGSAFPAAVAVDGSGNVAVTGNAHDTNTAYFYTAKYAAADGTLLWEQRYLNGGASAVALDGSGNVVVTGGASGGDYYTAKYAAGDGALLWEKRYNGLAKWLGLAVDGSGNVVLTGTSSNGNNEDYYSAKYAAADGALLWERRYNGPANGFDNPYAVAVDGSGNVVVAGFSGDASGSTSDYYTAKYAAANGALLWEQRYNGPGNAIDVATAVAVDSSGNVVVTGLSSRSGFNTDFYTAKYAAANGALLWEKRYNGPADTYDQAHGLAVDGSGNVVVTGYSNNGSNDDYYTAKYAAADGALLWEQRYNGPGNANDVANAVAVDGSGNVVVTGYSNNGSNDDYYTAKYAPRDGALLWEQRYNGPGNTNDVANAVAVDGDGNVVVTGYSNNGTNDDYYTAKYAAADGALLWEQRYNGPANRGDRAQAMALDGSGNVVVTGYSTNSGGNADYYTAKYWGVTGALLWEKRYNGPTNGGDFATAVAVDVSGNVVVTGYSYNGSNNDFYTAKYAAGNGWRLWEKRYNGVGGDDRAQAVAVDVSGNVVVTGSSYNGIGNAPYMVKYAAADGALLWGKAPNFGQAQAVATDGSGNVVVTGSSSLESGTYYHTAKYAAMNGALLWEQNYNGPANHFDYANAVAVDGSDNVVVTGWSVGNRSGYDYYTAKYAAADGALLWEQRYNGPASGDDRAVSLGLGPNGMVVITGSSVGAFRPAPMYDYATILYRENLPTITVRPANQAVFTGSAATFSVSATTTNPPISYQWRFNGADLPGATNASLTITNVQSGNAGDYQVVVTDSVGFTFSALASLSLIDAPPPTVTTLAASDIAANSATLHGTVNPNGALTVAHFEYGPNTAYGNNTPAVHLGSRANPMPLSIAVAGLLTNTTHHVRLAASNSGGTNYGVDQTFTTFSSADQLVAIDAQPQKQAVVQGASAVFTVSASSGFPLRYQWQFNAMDIAGATNFTLTVTNAQAANVGSYTVTVANLFTSVTSAVAILQVLFPATIVQPPQSRTNVVGSDATFSVTVTNTATLPINYSWRRGSTVITNTLLNDYTSSFTIYNVSTNDAATYRVVITNAASTPPGATATATLTVVTDDVPPTVTLTSPTNGATFTEPANIPLVATAEDSDGLIARVEFYAGANFLGTVAPPSYSLVWSSAPAGNYALTARAFDNFAARSDSAPVNISVLSSQTPHIDTIHLTDGVTTLTWSAQAGRVYRVQYKTNLAAAAWSDLPGDVTGAGASASKTDPSLGNALQRFYRVRLEP